MRADPMADAMSDPVQPGPDKAELGTEGGRPAIRLERALAHPAEKVWRALTERKHLEHWFPGAFDGEIAAGATLTFDSPGHGMPPMEGTVLAAEPPRLLAYSWGGNILRWELFPREGGCLLVLEQVFDSRPDAASFCAGWHTCFDALATALEGDPRPAPGERWAPRHEAYVAAFGLDAGTAEPCAGGVRISFARPMTAKPDDVRAVLDDLGRPAIAGAEGASVLLPGGPGGNARVVVEHVLPAGADVEAALTAWRAHLAAVAARLPGGGR